MKQYRKYLSLLLVIVAFNSNALQCGAGEVEVDGVCVSSCKILEGTGKNLTWDSYVWGDNPRSYCIGDRSTGAACNMAPSSVSISVEAGRWTNKFYYTGSTCGFDQINRYSGDVPELFPFEGDVNQNGVQDDLEDWDGDGIKNGEDPNPYSNDNQVTDNDGNNVPDNLDDYYEKLEESKAVSNCYVDDDNRDCVSYRIVMSELTRNNSQLASVVSSLSKQNLTKDAFNKAIAELINTQKSNDLSFAHKIDALNASTGDLENTVRESVWASRQDIKGRLDDRYNQTFIKLNKIEDIISGETNDSQDIEIIKQTAHDINSSLKALPTQLNAIHQHMDQNKNDLITKINNSSGGSGLTTTQEKQLKNAAKANKNLQILNGHTAFLEQLSEDFVSIDENVNSLSEQISSISSGSSTIDLSGVESSISDLSAKIDGLEVGDMSGVEGKIDDLIKGITNNNNFVEPSSSFTGEGFIVTPNQIAEVQNEVIEIKQEMTDEFEKFKALFSIDTSSFNNGTFKEHTLNLNINGSERSFKSGVFSALLDNAAIISAVIMFLFVLSGIRMLGKD